MDFLYYFATLANETHPGLARVEGSPIAGERSLFILEQLSNRSHIHISELSLHRPPCLSGDVCHKPGFRHRGVVQPWNAVGG